MSIDSEFDELVESVERGEWRSRLSGDRRRELSAAAEATLRRDARVNLRLSRHDLEAIKRMAAREGLPYQTYMASLLHKVVTGQIRPAIDQP